MNDILLLVQSLTSSELRLLADDLKALLKEFEAVS